MNFSTRFFAFLTCSSWIISALASDGAFDFRDPCIGARDEFAKQRQDTVARLKAFEREAHSGSATPEYREFWLQLKRKALRPIFDSRLAPLYTQWTSDTEKAFTAWFELILQISPVELTQRIDSDYRLELQKAATKSLAEFNAAIDQSSDELKKVCGLQPSK